MEIKMNNYKYDYPKLPLIIIFFAGIPYAIVIKSQTLYKFQDLGSANMILVTVLFFWCFLYWAFVDSTFNLITIFKNKIKFFQQDKSAIKIKDTLRDHSQISSVENIVKEDKLPILNEVETEIPHLKTSEKMVEDIIKKQKSSILLKEKQVLNCFLDYTKITMKPYITSDELKKLEDYICLYSSEKHIKSFNFLIETKDLDSDDLINFGYNMVNHFNFTILEKFAPILKNIFKVVSELDESTITRRLYFRKPLKKNKIICLRNISEYLDELQQDK